MNVSRGDEEIFESQGEPEETQSSVQLPSRETSEHISSDSVPPSSAFEYFHGQIYDNNLSAYENMLRASKHQHVGELSYSLADGLEKERGAESPFQRYARLKAEMEQLSSDLSLMNSEKTVEEGKVSNRQEVNVWSTLQMKTAELLKQHSTLEQSCLKAEELSKAKVVVDTDRLLAMKETVVNVDTNEVTKVEKSEVIKSPEITSSSFIRLEERVNALELLVGMASNTDISSLIAGGSRTFPLLENLNSLESRVNILDPVVLEMLSSKVDMLLKDMETLNKAQRKGKGKSNSISGGSMSDEQISSLAKKVATVDSFSNELPSLLLRLKTLAHVHQEAATFTARLSDLENSVDELSSLSQSNGEVMAALQDGFVSNMQTFKDNLEIMDSRIQKLS